MINFRAFRLFSAAVILITSLLIAFEELHYLYFLIEISLFLTVSFIFSFFIRSGFYVKALCSVPNDKKKIAITFDDGPVKSVTPQVLDILAKFNVKATFFCIGKSVECNKDLIARMHAEGHQIGNHTFSHSKFFGFFSSKKIMVEIQETSNAIASITGTSDTIFRPPFGITNPEVAEAVKLLDFTLVGWSVRTYDGTLRNKKKILSNAIRNLKSGDIVLFHDNHEQILEVLEQFLIHVSIAGLKPVRIDELND